MSSMVERVARAIFEAWAKEEGSDATWEEVVRASGDYDFPNIQKWHRMAFAEARAAIEAMREPTKPMVTAAGGALRLAKQPEDGELNSRQKNIIRYRAMVGSALE